MEGRDVPFDPKAVCDICGEKGAFDFMGDLVCSQCLSEDSEMEEEDYGFGEEDESEEE